MTVRLYTVFYVAMMLLVGAVVTGVYFDHPRAATISDDGATPAATTDYETYTPSNTDGPVTDAKPEPANQA